MTQSDKPTTRGPRRRDDTTRPPTTRSSARRSVDRRPYPTAPTTTKVSPAKPGGASTQKRSRAAAATPTPATVWACGPTPVDPRATWPPPIIAKIVGSFSKPRDRVVVLPWPATTTPTPLTPVGADGVIDRAPGADGDDDALVAVDIIESLDRWARVIEFPGDVTVTATASKPFWADLVGDPGSDSEALSPRPRSSLDSGALGSLDAADTNVDLVITSLPPEQAVEHHGDLVALLAARLLRVGGILVVLTHCDWSSGELIDPTGAVVAAGQNADLLYLQHVVAPHVPIHNGEFLPALDSSAPDDEARAQHRAAVRGLPAPHRRIHSDVLVFAQPHDQQPLPLTPAAAAFETGVIR
ncbi:hypothetical protein ACIA8G_21845 [Lentzea sp. NPDC051213]|uniref:hypothetical protein n=1 Tax=Lentzea sp. NPDC051213 TaxID=3364126 RepID=UPI00378A4790